MTFKSDLRAVTGDFSVSGELTANGVSFSDALKVLRQAPVSLSGTAVSFTDPIPANTYKIEISILGLSLDVDTPTIVRIGSGSFATTGYSAACSNVGAFGNTAISPTAGFPILPDLPAAFTSSGRVTIANPTGNTWVFDSLVAYDGERYVAMGAGNLALGGVLDRVQITTAAGTSVFDAGTAQVSYYYL